MTGTPTTSPRWDLTLDGRRHAVAVGEWSVMYGFPRTVIGDGVAHELGGFSAHPTVTPFDLDGHEASITLWHAMPGLRTRLRLAIVEPLQGRRRRAVAGRPSASLGWSVYELRLDGDHRGSWVATSDRGALRSWVFVEPGSPLPSPDWPEWPAPRA